MKFSYRIGDLEARGNENNIEIVKWYKYHGDDVCFVIAFVSPCKDEPADIRSVGMRMWEEDLKVVRILHVESSNFMMSAYMEKYS